MKISSKLSDRVAKSIEPLLQHKYDLVTYSETGTTDEYNQPIINENPPQVDKKCLFLWEDVNTTDERGTVIEHVPTLYALNSDVIKEGDLVTNVRDTKGQVLLKAAKVNIVDPVANLGSSIVRVCRLEGANL